jgi:hypothetical protein
MSAPASIFRPSAAYKRVRLPVERLVETLEHEGREMEAQAVRNLLESHQQQRGSLTDYHRRLAAATARLMAAVSEAA